MIINTEDFIENRFYMCRIGNTDEPDFIYYFKYKKVIMSSMFGDKEIDFFWETVPPNNLYKEKRHNSTLFPFSDDSKEKYIYTEVEYSDIVCYLPSGHPDIVEHRNRRIKCLLSNGI